MAKKLINDLDLFVARNLASLTGPASDGRVLEYSVTHEEIKRALIEVFYEILEQKNNIHPRYYN